MIKAIRSISKNKLFKILILTLATSFIVLWSIGNISFINPNKSKNIIKIGANTICQKEIIKKTQIEIKKLQIKLNEEISQNQIKKLGIIQGTLKNLAKKIIINEITKKLGIIIPNNIIKEKIYKNKIFEDQKKILIKIILINFYRNLTYLKLIILKL